MDKVSKEWLLQKTVMLQNQPALPIYLASLIVLLSIVYYYFKNKGLLPGPKGLPILGYWPFLNESTCHLELQKMQKKYGDIFCFNYCGALYIHLGSVKAVREVHVGKSDCFERIYEYSLMHEFFENSILFTNGDSWKTMRKFAIQQFKELGMTAMKDSMSDPIFDCIQETMDYLRSKKEEAVPVMQLMINKCNAILRRTMFGDSGITESEVQDLLDNYLQAEEFLTPKNTLQAGTLAKYLILPIQPGYWTFRKHYKNIKDILRGVLKRHKSKSYEENPMNIIDAYFKERDVRRSKGDPTAKHFTDDALAGTLVQFVGDGVGAVAGLVAIVLNYLLENEKEQEKIYSELQEVVGLDRAPTIDDKSKLPYTNAVMMESLRVFDFFPLFPSQQCTKETTIRGYRIPKGAITVVNFWSCHNNPDFYEEPEKFNPSRFIPQPGKQRPELPCTFGIGKRNCVGEGYSLTVAFLFISSLIKNFKVSAPNSSAMSLAEKLLEGKLEIIVKPRI